MLPYCLWTPGSCIYFVYAPKLIARGNASIFARNKIAKKYTVYETEKLTLLHILFLYVPLRHGPARHTDFTPFNVHNSIGPAAGCNIR